jgi:hypothetical protein
MCACSTNLSRILDVPGLPGRSGETIVMLTVPLNSSRSA